MLYEKLARINTGISQDYVDQNFGKPSITKNYLKTYTEQIYAHRKFFVRTISDQNGEIVFYSVTTRTKDFRPPFPLHWVLPDFRLGKTDFKSIDSYPQAIAMNDSSKLFYYNESHYFGNPGFYKTYFFEASTSGCCWNDRLPEQHFQINPLKMVYTKIDQWTATSGDTHTKVFESGLEQFRAPLVPNTYGVISAHLEQRHEKNLVDYLMATGISVDHFVAREL